MPIPDPHAIPETAEACTEYVTEANAAWDAGNPDLAWDLYHSVYQSQLHTEDQRNHATYRMALIALNRGDHDTARRFAQESHDPAAKDVLHSLDNAAGPVTPDPSRPPTTDQELDAYWNEGVNIRHTDPKKGAEWFGAIVQATNIAPEYLAKAQVVLGMCYHDMGDDATARQWVDAGFPLLSGEEEITAARAFYGEIGVHAHDDNTSPAAHQMVAGVEAFELGELDNARTALEAAMHLDGATDAIEGRASYYLGAMDYQAQKYAEARDHLERAVAIASDPEKGWAHEMLQWRWEENA